MEEYYKPELEEFRIGFEVELYNADEGYWGKYVVKDTDRPSDFLSDINSDCCRVKYLDKKDIESLEWLFHSERNIKYSKYLELLFQRKDKYLSFYPSDRNIQIHNNQVYEDERTWFHGIIKNKSELKQLMMFHARHED